MLHQGKFHLDTPIDDVMRICPSTINVLIERKMQCVGCVLACLHTVGDVAHEHGQDAEDLLTALNSVADYSHR